MNSTNDTSIATNGDLTNSVVPDLTDSATNAVRNIDTNTVPSVLSQPKGIYSFTVKDIDDKDVHLSEYSGKVMMIVNVASKCGFTGQYADLEKLYLDYKDRGLAVLGFPANNFLSQEPGSNQDIKHFCTLTYNVTFPMFSKISVEGKDQHPLYNYLTSKETNPEFKGKITWNFNKFIISAEGKIVARFGSRTAPRDDKVIQVIEAELNKIPAVVSPAVEVKPNIPVQ
jgi:glutathione peroxidase-family protein